MSINTPTAQRIFGLVPFAFLYVIVWRQFFVCQTCGISDSLNNYVPKLGTLCLSRDEMPPRTKQRG